MDTKITRTDECESLVEFSGKIVIITETRTVFERELEAVIQKYSI
jgi:hypothetical protein